MKQSSFCSKRTMQAVFAIQFAISGLSAARLPNPATDVTASTVKGSQTAVLAGGCFWGLEAVFERLKGVSDVLSGFSGGSKSTAHYELVSTGTTGHAESVKITYDPTQISFGQLLQVYFSVAHDPTQLNRQGPDSGTQYRSVIFYATEEQKRVAETYIQLLEKAKIFREPIVTRVAQLDGFYPAEQYHQNFIQRNPTHPYVVINDLPKLEHLQQQFPQLVKQR